MNRIEDLDPNFVQSLQLQPMDVFYDVREAPFRLHGLSLDDGRFLRMPEAVATQVSEGVHALNAHTSGGRVRFATDAAYLHVCVTLPGTDFMSHMPLTGSSGVDVWCDDAQGVSRCIAVVRPLINFGTKLAQYAATVELPGTGMRTVTLYLPLYDGINDLRVGLPQSACVAAPRAYALETPIVFYGSSITQGGCASRTSGGHCALLARWLDADFVNLGFSGNGKGEETMAHYIASLSMSAFVMDYDHNAHDAADLERTHAPFFRIVRQAHPSLPIVLISKPDLFETQPQINAERLAVILRTYEQARAAGDKQVYFVDGETLFGVAHRECCTVDGCHPTDLGFYRMAEGILPTLRRALESASCIGL
ncbi:MAG: SGNH/GDSL hydrolase family protein [Clostridia bacterium]